MNALTSALQVLIKSVWYKIYGWPIIILGVDPDGNPQAVNVDADGNLIVDVSVTPTGTQDVNLIKVGGTALSLGAKSAAASLPVVSANSGVQELRTPTTETGSVTVPAGAFSVSIFPLSGFVGTILGLPWVEANGAWNDSAQPGNTLPAYAITRSAGSYYLIVGNTP